MIEVRDFRGKINQDDNAYKVQKGDYLDALNITRDAQGNGQDQVVSTVVGNQSIPTLSATDGSDTIGTTTTTTIFFSGSVLPLTNILINLFDGTTYTTASFYTTYGHSSIPTITAALLANGNVLVGTYTATDTTFSITFDNTIYLSISYTITNGMLGTNKVIGNYADKVRNRQYFFTWNSSGYNTINYYDANTNSIINLITDSTLIDTGGLTILNFNPSFRINHIDIVYRDEDGDLLFWTDGFNPPSKINVKTAETGGYGVVLRSYIDVAKEPPTDPPYCVYQDNASVTINNLNNRLFKFKYRYVYDDLEKSVTSAQSEVAIPKEYVNQSVISNPTKNSSILIAVKTGLPNVIKIEILGSESLGESWSDFFLIKVIDNSFGFPSAQFNFLNEQAYSPIPLNESIQPFDNVPQKAYTQSLPNGNVLDYGAITENYNLITPDYLTTIDTNVKLSSYLNQTAEILLYKIENPNSIQIVIAGNPNIGDLFNLNYIYDTIPTSTSIIATGITTASLVTDIENQFIALGYTIQISGLNSLIISDSPHILDTYLPTGVFPVALFDNKNSSLVYDWASRYSYGVVYFDDKGRTNSVITSIPSSFETQQYDELAPPSNPLEIYIPQQILEINSAPPSWASYFELVRTKNLTKGNFLYWVSERTLKDSSPNSAGYQYAYISIGNLTQYIVDNPEIKTLGYEFVAGDRIRFIKLYDSSFVTAQIYTNHDFEIVNSVTNPVINGITIIGQVIKILLPTTVVGIFDFGTIQFNNYLIELYTPAPNFSDNLNLYYEFGEKYAINGFNTPQPYHNGMIQNQTISQPAIFKLYKGDSYFRFRTMPTGGEIKFSMGTGHIDFQSNLGGTVISNTNNNALYTGQNFTGRSGGISLAGEMPITYNSVTPPKIRIKGFLTYASDANSFQGNIILNAYLIGGFSFNFLGNLPTTPPLPPLTANQDKTVLFDYVIQLPSGYDGLRWDVEQQAGTIKKFEITITDPYAINQGIIDPNFSDTYDSAASPNGRAWKFDPNAGQAFNPTLIRFGGELYANTTVNNINRFYEQDNDQYDRSRGSIKKMFIEGRNQFIFQEFDVGVVTVLTQIVKDTSGNPLSAQSDTLLNKIVYPYAGQYGIGNVPESFAYGKRAKYFVDNNKGVVCRLSADGITPLSILYKMNAFFVAKLAGFKDNLNTTIPASGTPTVYGAFDAYTNKYIISLSEIDRDDLFQDPYTLAFLETRDASEGFESFLSFHPENMGALNNLFITFNAGGTWTHNNNTYCNFYTIQYNSYIDGVFNDNAIDKKSFLAIMQTSNAVWYCPSIKSQVNTYGSTSQETEINAARFVLQEGQYNSAILRDKNSPGGLINGQTMKGNYLIVRFQKDNASNFYYINTVSLKYNNSPLNTR